MNYWDIRRSANRTKENDQVQDKAAYVQFSGEFSDTPRIPAVYQISEDSKHWWIVFLRKRMYQDFKRLPNKLIKKMLTDHFA